MPETKQGKSEEEKQLYYLRKDRCLRERVQKELVGLAESLSPLGFKINDIRNVELRGRIHIVRIDRRGKSMGFDVGYSKGGYFMFVVRKDEEKQEKFNATTIGEISKVIKERYFPALSIQSQNLQWLVDSFNPSFAKCINPKKLEYTAVFSCTGSNTEFRVQRTADGTAYQVFFSKGPLLGTSLQNQYVAHLKTSIIEAETNSVIQSIMEGLKESLVVSETASDLRWLINSLSEQGVGCMNADLEEMGGIPVFHILDTEDVFSVERMESDEYRVVSEDSPVLNSIPKDMSIKALYQKILDALVSIDDAE